MNVFHGRPNISGAYWFKGKVRGINIEGVETVPPIETFDKMPKAWFKFSNPVLVNIPQDCTRALFFPCDWVSQMGCEVYTGIVCGAELSDMRGRWAGPVDVPKEFAAQKATTSEPGIGVEALYDSMRQGRREFE